MIYCGIGPFVLDIEQLLLLHEGRPVPLGPKVVATLLALIEHPGQILSKNALVDRIWPDAFVEEANLAQNIYVLRKTFRRHGSPDPIETVPRRGYRLTAPVRPLVSRLPAAASAADEALPVQAAPTPAGAFAFMAPPASRTLYRRIGAAIAGVAFVAASVVLVASYGFGHRHVAKGALSDEGARAYAVGRYYWNLRTREGVAKSLDLFARVVDSDPYDPRGYAALADANVTMGDYCYGTHRPATYFARARAYTKRALQLDPNSAEAHAAAGSLALENKDWGGSIRELQRAIALAPSYASAHEWYGIALLGSGHSAEGARQLKIAVDLDPLAVSTFAWLASAALHDRRFGDAVLYSRQALELSPQRPDVLRLIGKTYEAEGDAKRAIAAFKRFGASDPYYRPQAAALLAYAYAREHRMTEARAALALARASARNVDAKDLAMAATAVGESTATRDALQSHSAGTSV